MVEPICAHKRIFRKMSSPSFARSVMPTALQLLPPSCHVPTRALVTACIRRPWCSSSRPCLRLQTGSAHALPCSLPRQSSAESNDRQGGSDPVSCSVSSQSNRCPTAPRFTGMKHFGVELTFGLSSNSTDGSQEKCLICILVQHWCVTPGYQGMPYDLFDLLWLSDLPALFCICLFSFFFFKH